MYKIYVLCISRIYIANIVVSSSVYDMQQAVSKVV